MPKSSLRNYDPVTAASIRVDESVKLVIVALPKEVIPVIAAPTMSASMTAYSTAVGPSSPPRNLLRNLRIRFIEPSHQREGAQFTDGGISGPGLHKTAWASRATSAGRNLNLRHG